MPTSNQTSKLRIRCLKPRALVFDTTFGSCTIKGDKEIKENSEYYWPFELGPRTCGADTWDLYLNCQEDAAIAVEPDQSPGESTYLANLRLSKLGFKAKFLRKVGALSSGYVIRPLGPNCQLLL